MRLTASAASRDSLAEFGADLHAVSPELAKRFGELLGGLKTYQPGEVGLSGSAAAGKASADEPAPLTAEQKRFAEAHGLTEDEYREGME